MQISQIPRKFELPFAFSAAPAFIQNPIPTASQIGITPGAASLTDGFPPANFSPISSGGVPPRGVDFNGLLFQSTGWNQWQAAGGPIFYDSTFQAAIGGYPNGAIVQSNVVPGDYYQSTADSNLSNPDTGGANWIFPPGMMGTGFMMFSTVGITRSGWIIQNGTTIGSAASGATQRANSDCLFLYQYLWNSFSNIQCPVIGGRGATATADFNANKPIGVPNMQSSSIMGADGMGTTPTGGLNNVPIVLGSFTQAGSVIGENLHVLLAAELAAHAHGVSDPTHVHNYQKATVLTGTGTGATIALSSAGNLPTDPAVTGISIQPTGSNTAHNNVQRSFIVFWYIKL